MRQVKPGEYDFHAAEWDLQRLLIAGLINFNDYAIQYSHLKNLQA